jgi:hypothetical protein
LRELGADVNKQTERGVTAAEIARQQGHVAVAEILIKHCECCQKKGTDVKLNACSRCMTAYYCSVACQKQDWKQHKKTCGAANQA